MQHTLKRLFDIAAASGGLLLLFPLLLWLAWRVKRHMGSPVFFKQTRIGLRGKPFTLIKFRTMRDALDAQGNALPDAQRLTPFGEWLRRSSADELPELWNILRGDMSVVGPRPLLPEYLPYYTTEELGRHHMRPGITGLAQVHGRNATNWNTRLALDVRYVQEFSLWLDIKILWRTFFVVGRQEGIRADGHATMPRLDSVRRARDIAS